MSTNSGGSGPSRLNIGTVLNPKTGAVMTREEVIAERTKNGMCISCGEVRTHKKKFGGISMKALTITGIVENGTCVACFNPRASNSRNGMARQSIQANFSPRGSILRASYSQGAKRGSSGSTSHRQSNFLTSFASDDSASESKSKPSVRQSLRSRTNNLAKQSFSSFDSNGSSKFGDTSSADSTKSDEGKDFLQSFPPAQITTSATSILRSKARMVGKASKFVSMMIEEDESKKTETIDEEGFDRRQMLLQSASVHFNAVVKQKTFRNILDFERQNMEDGDEVAVAISELSKLAEEEYSHRKIEELSSMIKILSRAVEFSNKNKLLCEETCKLIKILAETGDDKRIKDLCSLGCGNILISLINNNLKDPEVLDMACTTLLSLTVNEEALKLLSERQLLKSLCKIIENDSLDQETVKKALDLILIIYVTPKKMQDMDGQMVVNTMIVAMTNDKNYDTFLCCFQIIRFALNEFGKHYTLQESILLECMQSYPTELSLQHEGIDILSMNASRGEKFDASEELFEYFDDFLECEVLGKNNGADVMVVQESILNYYHELLSAGLLSPQKVSEMHFVKRIHILLDANISGSKQIILHGLKILSLIPSDKLNFTEIKKSLGLLALIMDIYADDDKVLIESFHLLQSLISSEENAGHLNNANNIGIAKNVINNSTTDEHVIHTAFLSLHSMCDFISCREFLEQHEIMETVASIMARYLKCKDVQVSGIKILFKLSVHPGTSTVPFISVDVMTTILQVMNEYSDNPVIQVSGCDLFKNALFQERNIPNMQILGEILMERLLAASSTSPSCEQSAFSVMQIVFG